jgi:hypothetical protein
VKSRALTAQGPRVDAVIDARPSPTIRSGVATRGLRPAPQPFADFEERQTDDHHTTHAYGYRHDRESARQPIWRRVEQTPSAESNA